MGIQDLKEQSSKKEHLGLRVDEQGKLWYKDRNAYPSTKHSKD